MNTLNPHMVPTRTLASGEKIPAVGMGTFGSDRFTPQQICQAVLGAARFGYRLFDCAACYGNEDRIGEVFEQIQHEGIRREEFFVISKVWNDKHKPADLREALHKTLRDLRLDYLDAYLVHWPFRNYHEPGCDVNARNPNSHPYRHEEYMETWFEMERLQQEGLIRHLGSSNMTIPKLKLLLRDCRVRPTFNEMEMHPCFQQPELFDFCRENGIQPIGFCPIGSPTRPERDKTAEDLVDIQQPAIVEIARAHGVHPAVICVKWAAQRGQIPIPFSVYENEYQSNLRCVTEDPLTPEEMDRITAVNADCRLIKGQVFLWKGQEDWRVLWDEDGTICDR